MNICSFTIRAIEDDITTSRTIRLTIIMSNSYNPKNIDTVIEEVLEDIVIAVVSDSSDRQIETTVQLELQDILAMKSGYGDH